VTFSIITIVYNGASLIEGTMQSVLNQSFTDFEHLIIDGASKDETMKIVEKYLEKHPFPTASAQARIRAFSEPDKGLYDAMNKGLKRAKGDFVLFLNCGDSLFDTKTLEHIAACITPKTDILYGETMLVNDERQHIGTRTALTVQKLPETLTWKSLKYGMVVCHQSFVVKRSIAPFYMENNLAADIDWVIKCLKKGGSVTNTHSIISEYLMGGVSKQRHRQSLDDRYTVLKMHYGAIPNFFNHIVITLRAVWNKIKNWGKATY
jgi:glycosyltransferase involved in cell wall biosynthesis